MPTSLFNDFDERRRERLREHGWVGNATAAGYYWLRPDGVTVTEEEAFAQLDAGRAEFKEPRVG